MITESSGKNDSEKWSKAGLRISSKTLRPSDVEKILGLKATRMHEKGALRNPRQKATWAASLCLFNSSLSDRDEMPKHLKFLLDLFEPKVEALRVLSKDCELDLFCGFSSDNGQGGFVLDSGMLSRLAALRIPIVFDLHPPGPINVETGD